MTAMAFGVSVAAGLLWVVVAVGRYMGWRNSPPRFPYWPPARCPVCKSEDVYSGASARAPLAWLMCRACGGSVVVS